MPETARRYATHLGKSFRTALLGPQLLAFVPALTLGAYWYGGEGLLLFLAVFLPALLAVVSLFTPVEAAPRRDDSDPVTGLALRESLLASLGHFLGEERKTGRRTAALMLEIDDFERVAEQHGDEASEAVLRQVADRLQAALRDHDVVARFDGSVFAVALAPVRRLDLEAMIQLSSRLQRLLSEPVTIDGLGLHLTASVGFCLPRRAAEKSAIACLDAAKSALADAQANGPGSIRAFSPQPRVKRVLHAGLAANVAEALDKGQIVPWFQPQISTDTGMVSGMEVLARWDHPERGIILPGAFLPAVAAAGLSTRLTEVMLYHAMTALAAWDKAGMPVPMAGVNLAQDDLADPTLCDRLRWELDRFDLSPGRLAIEILETVVATSDDDTVTRNIAKLADMGCGIDLDDFGTGHASIASIRRFSVNRIKIDRSFVTRIDIDREQQQMLEAILDMAERLKLTTLAEGVETVGEHALLAQLGCDHVQGYSIARPMPFDATLEWMAKHRSKMQEGEDLARKTG